MSDERKVAVSGSGGRVLASLLAMSAVIGAGPYGTECMSGLKFKPALTKRFGSCPVCGTQRVNIYRRGKVWMCLKCWSGERK